MKAAKYWNDCYGIQLIEYLILETVFGLFYIEYDAFMYVLAAYRSIAITL